MIKLSRRCRIIRLYSLRAALLLVPLVVGAASPMVDETENDKAPEKTPLDFDVLVVTGVGVHTSKMQQSVSISTLESDQLAQTTATNAAELLRFVPGVRAESSAGEGNANVTVRGAPISAGGSRYVQWQEDGLPILLFGDIAFATADQFLRVDTLVDYIEVIRGGFAATATSNAPGGIVNVLTKFDVSDAAEWRVQSGIDNRLRRVDLMWGREITEQTQVALAGFYRVGDGGRAIAYNAADGGQLKMALQHQWPSGYWRLMMKWLDDQTPTFLPTPARIERGEIRSLRSIDPRVAYFIPRALHDPSIDRYGEPIMTDASAGLQINSRSIGFTFNHELTGGWMLENLFRQSDHSGRFIGLFPANNGDGATAETSTTFTATLFNTALDDLGNRFNDLRVHKAFVPTPDHAVTVTAGVFLAEQTVALTWNWNQYTVAMRDHDPDVQFLRPAYETWGNCCVRTFDVRYRQKSPYAVLQWQHANWNVDASVRREWQQAFGSTLTDDALGHFDPTTFKRVDYDTQQTAFSWGANYRWHDDVSLFVRDSEGFAYSADRLLYGKALDGSLPIDHNRIRQREAGLKWRDGAWASFVTLFRADTDESNYEATTQQFSDNRYRASGVEWELSMRHHGWQWQAGITWTDADIVDAIDISTIGNRPRRQAHVTYQLMPRWRAESGAEVAVSVVGTGRSFADDHNQFELPAFYAINVFGRYPLTGSTELSLSINNLENRIGFTEAESDGHAARSISGRVATASLVHRF